MTVQMYEHQSGKKPSKIGGIIAWTVVILAVLIAIFSVFSGSAAERLGGLILSAAIGLPAVWALYCRSQDRKNAAAFNNTKKPRRWGRVAIATVAMYIASGVILPTPEPTGIETATVEESSTPRTTPTTVKKTEVKESAAKESKARESLKREAEESAVRKSAEEKAQAEEEARLQAEQEAEAERVRIEEENARLEAERLAEEQRLQAEREVEAERVRIAQEQAWIEQERIQQQQQIQQFAPVVPAQTTSYKNCTDVWNRINGPIYAGQPGYTSGPRKLDGNSDGVGCEKDPR